MHDGDSVRIEDAIARHNGEAAGVTQNFERLSEAEKRDLLLFGSSGRCNPDAVTQVKELAARERNALAVRADAVC